MAVNYKIFISHSWSYPQDIENLKSLLSNRGYFNVAFQEATQNEPINSQNAYYIKQVLANRISDSNIVLGIAGIYASYSDWIAWEMETAAAKKVPIIGIVPYGQERISATVTNHSVEDVRWNTESIIDAIRRHAR